MEKHKMSMLGWVLIAFAAAFVGLYFSDFFGDIFNGLPSGTGCILGMGAYLCIVVIVCTGIIVTKLDGK